MGGGGECGVTRLALIRHARTAWSEAGYIQGRADPPLSERGRAEAARWVLPPELEGVAWVASPLARAVETARLLGAIQLTTEARLIEMDWGEWEGRMLADLRTEIGAAMAENEARGLDFTPAGGESPRLVQTRVRPWLAEVARGGRAVAAVTHKGVIRAILALACDWDMTGAPPVELDWSCVHLFRLAPSGAPRPERLNLPLAEP